MKLGLRIILLVLVTFSYRFVLAGDLPAFVSGGQRAAIDTIKKSSTERLNIKWDDRKVTVKVLSGNLTRQSKKSVEDIARDFISHYSVLWGVTDLQKELVHGRTDETANGHFVHFNQKKDGMDVVGSSITIRVVNGIITTVTNSFEPALTLKTVPTISSVEAATVAKTSVGLPDQTPDVALVVLPWEDGIYLSYRVDFPYISSHKPSKYRVYVDANNGAIVAIENRIMHNGPAVGTGLGVDGVLKTFDTYQIGAPFYLGNRPVPALPSITIKTHSANNGTVLPGIIMQDADNSWNDPAGVDAHFFGNFVFDFYKNNFSNVSWFPASGFKLSGGIVSTVHYDVAYDNAFWDGQQMVYGDGDVIFYPLSGALDVVAHEITHGVTEAINNLTYCKESGALNESWSDVMGMFASIDYGDDLPYWSGEEIMKIAQTPGYEAYYALRRLDDPPFRTDTYALNDYNPANPLNSWGQPEHTSEQYNAACLPWTDNGGVHINSGIPNKAAYLITTNIGPAKAKQIYYNAMFYLTASSKFVDARNAVEQATIDLYGVGTELTAVQNAFTTVGIP